MLENLQYVVFINPQMQIMPRFSPNTHVEVGEDKKRVPVLFDEAIIRGVLPAKVMVVVLNPKTMTPVKSTVIEKCEVWPPLIEEIA
ncbi:hypothetical protein RISINGSUN_181 [Erwinia phage vB_EamM_RisingSun]|uniref:Uncharacterized protein n=1 Tax=Erwinia phage vB_EamM_RisingSun TaxID=2026080 RepID=A0A223LJ15_9CAUD|nr:hypothetical protein FDI45_gp181 [Erwinia phage vB_EamM_RisingSun]ASU03489.1 hypothetical protein RISINGSUN_181 [Erwinia phage vB_EamM_RisingSun]